MMFIITIMILSLSYRLPLPCRPFSNISTISFKCYFGSVASG
jgi:hypothetical protein